MSNTSERLSAATLFGRGDYEIDAVPTGSDGPAIHILTIQAPHTDEGEARYIPHADLSPLLNAEHRHRRLVTSALVRAGARHPGIDDASLRNLHRTAHQEGHVELFCDLNVLGTGLIRQLVDSLGRKCCRVVVSSSSIDILHEYEGRRSNSWNDALIRSEMSRCLGVLEELRNQVAVHIHPLPPGATFHMMRGRADAMPDSEESDAARTHISEDRMMIAAFWHYIQTTNPRVPVRLVTSDFLLARVCAAERVPFVFAKTPYEVWWKEQLKEGQPANPELLWLDPFALTFRAAPMHLIMRELALVYGQLRVRVRLQLEAGPVPDPLIRDDFTLSFNPWTHSPASLPAVLIGPHVEAKRIQATKKLSPAVVEPTKRRLKLSLQRVFEVMPTRAGGRVPLASFKPTDDDALRQLGQIGQVTDLFTLHDKWIEGRAGIERLLDALQRRDYVAVNDIFRSMPAYDDVLNDAAAGKPFPNNKTGGAATGWAIILGAAYKTAADGVLFGLEEVDEGKFEEAVARYHSEFGKGERSVPLPPILDRVCRSLQISPIRFEATLDATIGNRGLADFEAQRATVRFPMPIHPVVVAPTSAASAAYLREVDFGSGIIIGTKVVGALVARARGTAV